MSFPVSRLTNRIVFLWVSHTDPPLHCEGGDETQHWQQMKAETSSASPRCMYSMNQSNILLCTLVSSAALTLYLCLFTSFLLYDTMESLRKGFKWTWENVTWYIYSSTILFKLGFIHAALYLYSTKFQTRCILFSLLNFFFIWQL